MVPDDQPVKEATPSAHGASDLGDLHLEGADRVTDANLRPTRLCDSGHASIVAKAAELTAGVESENERAQRIFYFVRDQFPFRAGDYTVPASRVLVQGHGMCVTKTVLMSALMRAAGFPTRYRWVPLDKRGFFGFYPHWVNRIAIMKSPTVCRRIVQYDTQSRNVARSGRGGHRVARDPRCRYLPIHSR